MAWPVNPVHTSSIYAPTIAKDKDNVVDLSRLAWVYIYTYIYIYIYICVCNVYVLMGVIIKVYLIY